MLVSWQIESCPQLLALALHLLYWRIYKSTLEWANEFYLNNKLLLSNYYRIIKLTFDALLIYDFAGDDLPISFLFSFIWPSSSVIWLFGNFTKVLNVHLKPSQCKLIELCQRITKEMLNWYKIHLSSEICFEQNQLCIADQAVQTEKFREPTRRATWNPVLSHCCAQFFIWKFKYIKTMRVLALLFFLTQQPSLTVLLPRPHFSCTAEHEQDGMDVLQILSQISSHLVFFMLSISSTKLAELYTAP